MKKKYWLTIVIAAVCLLVLIGTLWAVLGGVNSQMPQGTDAPPVVEKQDDTVVSSDENYPMVDESGVVIEGEDNALEDPWSDVVVEDSEEPTKQDEVSEIPQDEILTDEELAVTDEGWSGIY